MTKIRQTTDSLPKSQKQHIPVQTGLYTHPLQRRASASTPSSLASYPVILEKEAPAGGQIDATMQWSYFQRNRVSPIDSYKLAPGRST
eukprot:1214271-Pleurochrysis_carterae.AAC.4